MVQSRSGFIKFSGDMERGSTATSLKGYVESVQVAKRHKVEFYTLKNAGWADVDGVFDGTQPSRKDRSLNMNSDASGAENDPHDGKRKCEALWTIFKIAHQQSRYVFDLYHRRKEISAELFEFCLDQGYADRNLIAISKKASFYN
ncbi:protein BUD31 homolog 2 [Tanacetum coccineum]